MAKIINMSADEIRETIRKLRDLTFGIDNLHSLAAQEADNFKEVDRLTAEEIGEGVMARLSMEYDYTDLLEELIELFEKALYAQEKKAEPTTAPVTGPTF